MALYLRRSQRKWLLCLFALLVLLLTWLRNPSYQRHPYPLAQTLDPIPSQIFQLLFHSGSALDNRLGESVQSWVQNNPGFTYTLLNNDAANDFATQNYANHPNILSTFLNIRTTVLRADLCRYMVIASKGGYYGDVDTTLYKSIPEWIPAKYREQVRFVVGIEYDQRDNAKPSHGFSEHISFAQWTFGASKGHPILMAVVENVVSALRDFARKKGTTVEGLTALDVPDHSVGDLTGPQVWTNAVFEGMSKATGSDVTWKNVTGIVEPKLFGDILLLPVDAFGTGQPHSGARQDIGEGTFVRHQWKMSWRDLNPDGSMKTVIDV